MLYGVIAGPRVSPEKFCILKISELLENICNDSTHTHTYAHAHTHTRTRTHTHTYLCVYIYIYIYIYIYMDIK
jgi:hypothetical protein